MKNYIIKHWNGDYSLPHSFWLNGAIIANSTCYLVDNFLVYLSDLPSTPEYSSYLLIIFDLFLFISICIWKVVGIWRSANRDIKEKNGNNSWGTAAKVVVVLGLMVTVSKTWQEFEKGYNSEEPVQKSQTRGASSHFIPKRYAIKKITEQIIEVDGEFEPGIEKDIEKVLKDNDAIWLIAFNSNGGDVESAEKIRDIIERNKLSTAVTDKCYSACPIAFMAGKTRIIIHESSEFGFHSLHKGYLSGSLNKAANARYETKIKNYYISKGLSEDFIDKGFYYDYTEMWYPEVKELIANNIATHYLYKGEFIPVDEIKNWGMENKSR